MLIVVEYFKIVSFHSKQSIKYNVSKFVCVRAQHQCNDHLARITTNQGIQVMKA